MNGPVNSLAELQATLQRVRALKTEALVNRSYEEAAKLRSAELRVMARIGALSQSSP